MDLLRAVEEEFGFSLRDAEMGRLRSFPDALVILRSREERARLMPTRGSRAGKSLSRTAATISGKRGTRHSASLSALDARAAGDLAQSAPTGAEPREGTAEDRLTDTHGGDKEP